MISTSKCRTRKNNTIMRYLRPRNALYDKMKSAYELAMERLDKSSPISKLTDEQRKQLADLDSRYAAKIAEREIVLKDELARAAAQGDAEACERVQKQLADDRRSLLAELEEKKNKVRQGKG